MGYYVQNGGGGGGLLWALMFIVIGIFLLVFISKNPAFKKWLSELGKMLPTGQQQAPPPPGGQQQQQPPPGGTSANTVTGSNIYKVVRAISTSGNKNTAGSGGGTEGCSATNAGDSQRDNLQFDCNICNREATWILKPPDSGDWSVKMGSHGDEGGQEALIEMGQICVNGGGGSWRCEGPHQDYNDVNGGSGSAPSIAGLPQVGIKGISWTTGTNTVHHEIWVDTTGAGNAWTKVGTFDGSAEGCANQIACPVPGSGCQDTLRLDNGSGHQWISERLDEIQPGQLAGGGTTTTTPPATTPPTTTTPSFVSFNASNRTCTCANQPAHPAPFVVGAGRDEDDCRTACEGGTVEDEEEEDDEEDDEETPAPTTTPPRTTPPTTRPPTSRPPSGGGTPTGSSQGGCPARCAPLRNSPSSYQACCGSGVAGLARVNARRAMLSRFDANDFAYSAYKQRRRNDSQIEFGLISRRIKIGNLI